MNTCDKCKYATWDIAEAYHGGYWFVDGCNLPLENVTEEEIDIEWGNTKSCPYWEEIE